MAGLSYQLGKPGVGGEAAAPLVSATSLAAGPAMAVKNAAARLGDFCAAGGAVEVTHRSRRRLFGLKGLIRPCATPSACPTGRIRHAGAAGRTTMNWLRRPTASYCRRASPRPSR